MLAISSVILLSFLAALQASPASPAIAPAHSRGLQLSIPFTCHLFARAIEAFSISSIVKLVLNISSPRSKSPSQLHSHSSQASILLDRSQMKALHYAKPIV